MLEVALLTLTQKLAAADVLGRVYGVQETVFVIATALGSVLAAALTAALGGAAALIVTGLVLAVLAIALRPRLGTLEAARVPERAFQLLRAPPMFAPLPIATSRTWPWERRDRTLPEQRRDCTQGDPGANCYIIDDGTVEARKDDTLLARLSEWRPSARSHYARHPARRHRTSAHAGQRACHRP